MYARTITIDARPESIDAGLAYIRDEVFDAVTSSPGCVGMSMVADRESGLSISTSAWESEASMRGSLEALRPVRDRAEEIFGAPVQIQEWEVAVMHRDHHTPDGACVRSTWVQGDPAQIDRAVDVFRLSTLPALDQLEGFCSASMLVNRTDGRAIVTVAYDGREALERTRAAANGLRSSLAADTGATVQDVREFDLAMAHLHAPEMA